MPDGIFAVWEFRRRCCLTSTNSLLIRYSVFTSTMCVLFLNRFEILIWNMFYELQDWSFPIWYYVCYYLIDLKYYYVIFSVHCSIQIFIDCWTSKLTVSRLILSYSRKTMLVQNPDSEVNGKKFLYVSLRLCLYRYSLLEMFKYCVQRESKKRKSWGKRSCRICVYNWHSPEASKSYEA